jgi:hypothetical protein
MAAKRMRDSSLQQLWLYDRTKTMSGHLTHLGDTSEQHAPLVFWRNPGSDWPQALALASLCDHRGWLVHKQINISTRVAAGSDSSGISFLPEIMPVACR